MEQRKGDTKDLSPLPKDLAPARQADAGPRIPRSVNLHLTALCNRTCEFCYQTPAGLVASLAPNDRRPLDREEWRELQALLAAAGIERVTYAGGEPTLVPYLTDLALDWYRLGRSKRPRAMIVTNGTALYRSFVVRIRPALAAVKLSFESATNANAKALGRGRGNQLEVILDRARMLHDLGIPVHLNSVITARNVDADLTPLVEGVRPSVWKVFQFLPVPGENDARAAELAITREQFDRFLERHATSKAITAAEDNDLMRGSYAMVDSAGRFLQSTVAGYDRSEHSILEVGVERALAEVGGVDWAKYDLRGGDERAFGPKRIA